MAPLLAPLCGTGRFPQKRSFLDQEEEPLLISPPRLPRDDSLLFLIGEGGVLFFFRMEDYSLLFSRLFSWPLHLAFPPEIMP